MRAIYLPRRAAPLPEALREHAGAAARGFIRSEPIACAEPASGRDDLHGSRRAGAPRRPPPRWRAASPPRARAARAPGDVPIAAVGHEAEHAVAAARAREIQVRRAPHAAVDVLAAADLDRARSSRESRRTPRPRRPRSPRARRPSRTPRAAGAAVDRDDVQPPVEARPERVDARAQVVQLDAPGRDAREHGRAGERAAGRRGASAGAASGENAPSEMRLARSSAARSAPERRSGSTSPSQRMRSSPRRGSSPPASRAATIDPAEVPISCFARRKSSPLASLRAAEVAPHPGLAEDPAPTPSTSTVATAAVSTLPERAAGVGGSVVEDCDGRNSASPDHVVRRAVAQAAPAARDRGRRGRRPARQDRSAARADLRTSSS